MPPEFTPLYAKEKKAEELFKLKKYQLSIVICQEILEEVPDHVGARCAIAWSHYHLAEDLKSFRSVLKETEEIIRLAPENPEPYDIRSSVYYSVGDFVSCYQMANKTLELDPEFSQTYRNQVCLLGDLGAWNLALSKANKLLEFEPQNIHALGTRIQSYLETGSTEKALKESTEIISIAPANSQAYDIRGWALLKTGNLKEAEDMFKESLRLDPVNESAKHGLIDIKKFSFPLTRLLLNSYRIFDKIADLTQSKTFWISTLSILITLILAIAGTIPKQPGDLLDLILAISWFTLLSSGAVFYLIPAMVNFINFISNPNTMTLYQGENMIQVILFTLFTLMGTSLVLFNIIFGLSSNDIFLSMILMTLFYPLMSMFKYRMMFLKKCSARLTLGSLVIGVLSIIYYQGEPILQLTGISWWLLNAFMSLNIFNSILTRLYAQGTLITSLQTNDVVRPFQL